MDAKFTKRFESYSRSVDALAEARKRDFSDSFVLSGTAAKFNITFELAWKVMKDILVQIYAISDFVTGSPRDTLRKAYQARLIDDDIWMEMLECRNLLAHDYDGDIIRARCREITGGYMDAFFALRDNVVRLTEEEAL